MDAASGPVARPSVVRASDILKTGGAGSTRRAASAGSVILGMQPGSAPRLPRAARADQADDPLTVTRPRRQELQHPVIVDAAARKREAHLMREVEVADAHGIGVAERADPRLGARPRPHPAQTGEDVLAPVAGPRGG